MTHHSPRYSIAACLAETASRLVATAGGDGESELLRTLGSALRSAEPISLTSIEEARRVRGRQGIALRLGFYDAETLHFVSNHEDCVAYEFSRTLGGFDAAVQVDCERLPDNGDWLGTDRDFPTVAAGKHLHRYVLDYQERPEPSSVCAGAREFLLDRRYLIVARRLRYRLGVDHADNSRRGFWWTTAQTRAWIRGVGSEVDVNYLVSGALTVGVAQSFGADPASNNPDDWGCVRLEDDPLNILTVGPYGRTAETHSDVRETLGLGGEQLRVTSLCLDRAEAPYPLKSYAEKLRQIAQRPDLLKSVDVVLVYRGGGLCEGREGRAGRDRGLIDSESRNALANEATALAARGVEVVLGIGHGSTAVFDDPADRPVGVHEAVTPTAAAVWVLREHINNRLAGAIPDPGQPAVNHRAAHLARRGGVGAERF